MRIKISEKLKPFCHVLGTSCPIPWSPWKVQAFPGLLKFQHLVRKDQHEYPLNWKGPVQGFTLELDLEKGVVWVFGHTAEGYRRAMISMTMGGLKLTLEKEKQKVLLTTGEAMVERAPEMMEKFSLGSLKALDWEMVCRRKHLSEILPVWHRLGQMVPLVEGEKVGTAALLKDYDKSEVESAYLKLFLVGFEGILTPRLSDTEHQGIIEEGEFNGSPLILLTEGARYIRSLFFKETTTGWSFLPSLSPRFHAGKWVGLRTEAGDNIHFEWSKKLLRRVVIKPALSREVFLSIPKPLISYRLRRTPQEKGVRWAVDQPLRLEEGQALYLDRFEK